MPDEELLDNFVNRYLQKQIAQGASSGMDAESIEAAMEAPSFILTIKMLRNYFCGPLPAAAPQEVVDALAVVMQETPAEARAILGRFVAREWLNTDFTLTPSGFLLVGSET